MFNSLRGSGPEAHIGSIPAELGSIDECIAKLRGIAERKDHEAVWKKRRRLIESLSYDDIRVEIERIIWTAEESDVWDSD